MLSPRRSAQFGLCATCLILAGSLSVLLARSAHMVPMEPAQPGAAAPDFQLKDTEGGSVRLSALRGTATLIYFSSPRCPVSLDYADRVAALTKVYQNDPRLKILAISSNSESDVYEIRVQARFLGRTFPTLIDSAGKVAGVYSAKVTPTFILIDEEGVIRYRGPFDDNRNATQVRQRYCADAVGSLLGDRPISVASAEAFGCPIKQR